MISAETLSGLVGIDVARLEPVRRGGNSRVFKVIDAGGGAYAAKVYPPIDDLGRDRLATEWTALTFLTDQGVACVPRPISRHDTARLALYAWMEGAPVADGGDAEVAAMLDFVARLKEFAGAPAARALPAASEACFGLDDIDAQISRRWDRYSVLAVPELVDFLAEAAPIRAALAAATEARDRPLDPRFRTLSPSDFGLHNAVRGAGGALGFTDFEYFGWDDPVKLIADMLWHPAMRLAPSARSLLVARAAAIFADDVDFMARLRAFYPWFGLRWSLIALSEFLPERWSIRAHAGREEGPETVLPRQLSLARSYLARIRDARDMIGA